MMGLIHLHPRKWKLSKVGASSGSGLHGLDDKTIGAIVGSVVGFILVVGVLYCVYHSRKQKRDKERVSREGMAENAA